MAYSFIRALTIDHTKVTANLTDYPFGLIGPLTWLKTVANGGNVQSSSGYDIIFSTDTAGVNTIPFERVYWSATTGACEFWVKLPSVSSSVDTVIYVLYGNASVTTDQATPSAVWDSNYVGVYHFGTPTSLSVADSTSYANNGTNHGVTATTGQWGGAGLFSGNGDHGDPSGAQWVDFGTPFNNGSFTLEFFGVASGPGGMTIVSNQDGSGHGYQIHMPGGSNTIKGGLDSTDELFYTPGGVYNPYQSQMSYDGATAVLWSADKVGNFGSSSYSISSAVTASSSNMMAGREPTNGTNLWFGGSIDEIRVSKSVRSTAYAQATMRNVYYGDFFAVGSAGTPTVAGRLLIHPGMDGRCGASRMSGGVNG